MNGRPMKRSVAPAERSPSCTCAKCQTGCVRAPGWFTPTEAEQAIAGGFAPRLMRDWLEPCREVGNKGRIYVLAPASRGSEGDDAPECHDWISGLMGTWSKGRCTFFVANRCEIHESGFKPVQCRTAFMCGKPSPDYPDNYAVARLWNTKEGRAVVRTWQAAIARMEKGR